MSADGRKRKIGRNAGWPALAVALLAAAGALLPLRPQFLSTRLTHSFAAVLHFDAAARQSDPTRLVSTFGPLGFVFYDLYLPDTFAALVASRALLASITCWALAWIGHAVWTSPWGAALVVVACAPFLATMDVWLLTLPLLAVLIEVPERKPPATLRLAVGAALGIVSLIKFTGAIAVVAALVPLTAATVLAQRRLPLQTMGALAAAIIGWIATGRNGADLVAYLDLSLRDIVPGYASAMQLRADARLVLHAVATSVAVFAAGCALLWQRWRRAAWPAVTALGAITFLLFKAGFVRADVHVFITVFGLLAFGALLAVVWSTRPLRLAVAVVLVAACPGALWLHAVAVQGAPYADFSPVFPGEALLRLSKGPSLLFGTVLDDAYARRAADLRAVVNVPRDGPVDIYSYEQSILVASGAEFRPRPVFQSYMAYTPRLARSNADFLLGERAPRSILFRVEPIDDRLPALDDAPSWPVLLANYEAAGRRGEFAVLRRSSPRRWRLEPIMSTETRTGMEVSVPSAADGAVWARIDVQETFADAVARTLLAAPIVRVEIAATQSETRAYRIVSGLARDGFLLSPLVRTTGDFLRLFGAESNAPTNEVAHFRVRVDPPLGGAPVERGVRVEFLRLVVEPPAVP